MSQIEITAAILAAADVALSRDYHKDALTRRYRYYKKILQEEEEVRNVSAAPQHLSTTVTPSTTVEGEKR